VSVAPSSISAIVPVHHGAHFLADALRSVRRQTLPADEIIVVVDDLSDGCADVVRREHPDAILIQQPRGGAAAARNAGARRARCEALAFFDQDDLWLPERNAVLLHAWRANPEADVICGAFRVLAEPGANEEERLMRAEGNDAPFQVRALMIRRLSWLALGGVERERDCAEDLDLYLRLIESGANILRIDAATLIYRMHAANQARVTAAHDSSALLSTLRAAVLRRRA
jgi:glycosyltransferase involved in cell wall biosynthesis